MATLFAGNNGGIDLSTFDLAAITSGTPTTMSTTDYRIPNVAEYRGFDFTYTGNSLTGGTITDITVFNGALNRYEITNIILPVADVDKFLSNGNDSQGFLAEVFAGTDKMTGSNVADHLLGFDGGDTMLGNEGNDTLEGGVGNDT
jgi:Ca2+-binding RTX toxin-like protein